MNEQWLSIIEYARIHDISDMTVRRRIKKGKLEAVLKDGKYFIPVSSQNSHIEQFTTPARMPVTEQTPPAMRVETTTRPHVAPRHIPKTFDSVSNTQSHYANQEFVTEIESTLKSAMDSRATNQVSQKSVSFDNLKFLSKSVLNEIQKDRTSLVSTQRLLEYCDSLVNSVEDQKKLLQAKIESERVISYQHEIKALQLENEKYRQQIEDLHVLVKLLEKSN